MAARFRFPSREGLLASRPLRPFAPRLSRPHIWRFSRRGVARGAALGLFSGFAVPIAQTPFAAMLAVMLRANLAVAALFTFVTNPLTVPLIYYLAFRTGAFLLATEATEVRTAPHAAFLERALAWVVAAAGPTYLGLLVFAAVGAVAGFFGVHFGWRLMVVRRWRRRRRARRAMTRQEMARQEAKA